MEQKWLKRNPDYANRLEVAEPKSGLTESERKAHDTLMIFNDAYAQLPRQHPSESRIVTDAIHQIQLILMARIARRKNPSYWPTYDLVPTEK